MLHISYSFCRDIVSRILVISNISGLYGVFVPLLRFYEVKGLLSEVTGETGEKDSYRVYSNTRPPPTHLPPTQTQKPK